MRLLIAKEDAAWILGKRGVDPEAKIPIRGIVWESRDALHRETTMIQRMACTLSAKGTVFYSVLKSRVRSVM